MGSDTPGGTLHKLNPPPQGAAGRILGPAIRPVQFVKTSCKNNIENARSNHPKEIGSALFHHSLPSKFKHPRNQIRDWNSAIVSSKTKKVYINPAFDRDGHLFATDPVSREEIEVPAKEVRSLFINRPKRVLNFKDILKKKGLCAFHINALRDMIPVNKCIDSKYLYLTRDVLATEKKQTSRASKKPNPGKRQRAAKRCDNLSEKKKTPVDLPKTNEIIKDPKKIYESIEVARVASTIRNQDGLIDLLRFKISQFKPSHLASPSIRAFKIMLGPCPDNERLLSEIIERFYPSLNSIERLELLHAACTPERFQNTQDSSVSHSSSGGVSYREHRIMYNCGCVTESIINPPSRDVAESFNTSPDWIRRCGVNTEFKMFQQMHSGLSFLDQISRHKTCVGQLGHFLGVKLAQVYTSRQKSAEKFFNSEDLLESIAVALQNFFQIENLDIEDEDIYYAAKQIICLFDPRKGGQEQLLLH